MAERDLTGWRDHFLPPRIRSHPTLLAAYLACAIALTAVVVYAATQGEWLPLGVALGSIPPLRPDRRHRPLRLPLMTSSIDLVVRPLEHSGDCFVPVVDGDELADLVAELETAAGHDPAFEQPHRKDRSDAGFGPFTFDRRQYEAAAVNVAAVFDRPAR